MFQLPKTQSNFPGKVKYRSKNRAKKVQFFKRFLVQKFPFFDLFDSHDSAGKMTQSKNNCICNMKITNLYRQNKN